MIFHLLAKLQKHSVVCEKSWIEGRDAPSKASLLLLISETFSREATATRSAWNAALTGGFNHRFLNNHFML
jgi:hypothetical protein